MANHTGRERVATILSYGIVLLIIYLVYRVFQPFLVALGWAAVIAVFFHPLYARAELRWGRNRAAALVTIGVTLVLIVPALLLMTAFLQEGLGAARGIQQAFAGGQVPWVDRAARWLQQRAPEHAYADLPALAREGTERLAGFLASRIGSVLRNLAVFAFNLVVTLFATYFLFRDGRAIVGALRRVLPFEEGQRERIILQARDLISASVTSGFVVAGVQGLLGGLAFALLGLAAPVFWGVMMGFFSLLPLIGAWVIYVPAALWLFLSGEALRGIILVAIGIGIVSTVDNFLRPALITGQARLHGLLVFISLLGGVVAFGMIGLVLGPIVVATAQSILEVQFKRGEPKQAEISL